jgi:uncharacterized protein YukJ
MANHYCMFKGKLKFGVPYLDGYNGNPHYAIVAETPDGAEFVVLANVKSDSTMPGAGEAGYHVLYQWTQDFKLPMTADLAALEPGLHQDGFPRIDYVRDTGMVDFPNMQPIALDTATEHNDINALVDTMLTLDRTAAPIDYVYHGSSGDDGRKGWPPRADVTVAHYVTDGKVAFVAYARLVGSTPADQLIDETVSLFQTARLGIPEVPAPAPISAGKP